MNDRTILRAADKWAKAMKGVLDANDARKDDKRAMDRLADAEMGLYEAVLKWRENGDLG